MERVVLSIGTNLNDRARYMSGMVSCITGILIPPCSISNLMETEPLGMKPGTPWFLNRIVSGNYSGSPEGLLNECLEIEIKFGRKRTGEVENRTADIDILFFGDRIIDKPELTVPHPHLLQRKFCFEGMMQTSPGIRHPNLGKTMEQLWKEAGEQIWNQKIRIISD